MKTPRKLAVAALVAFLAARSATAQERDPAPTKDPAPLPPRFFSRPIDYWQQGWILESPPSGPAPAAAPPSPAPRSAPKPDPSDWGQRIRQADGTFTVQELPRPLVQVLEDPSPDNVRAYFEWKQARTRKILRAAEALKTFRASGLPPAEADLPPDQAQRPNALPEPGHVPERTPPPVASVVGKTPTFTVLYFHRKGCSHCDQEDQVLRNWLADKPEGTLSTLEFGEEPERWREFRVRGTPSLVLQSRWPGRSIFLEGLHSGAELDRALAESARPIVAPMDSQKGGPP